MQDENLSELDQRQWSVVSTEKIEAGELTYDEAVNKLEVLKQQDIHGLCIMTQEAANRMVTKS